jgi:dTDP-4-dehydrorhamnose 3,5-epimerase
MGLTVEKTPLDGLLCLKPQVFTDSRGYLVETYQEEKYRQVGISKTFVQDNQSYSLKGVLRGLHTQLKHPQAKLVRAASGEIFDIAVDARPTSRTFGQWHGILLSSENHKQLFIPEGFLHGFCVLSESAVMHYKCSDVYVPDDQWGVLWDDPQLGITWPIQKPILSDKDLRNLSWGKFIKNIK